MSSRGPAAAAPRRGARVAQGTRPGRGARLARGVRIRRLPIALSLPPPRLRRRLLAIAAGCAVLAAAYLFWLRDSSLVAVERVSVTGLSTADSDNLRAALTAAARSMTTLHVDHDRLERAVSGYPVVRELRVSADFPDTLRIEVVEHRAAAIAVSGGSRVPVAGDGTVLRGLPAAGKLPEIRVRGALPPRRLADPRALRAALVAGAAPAVLAGRLLDVREGGPRGIVVRIRRGPDLIFGDAGRAEAKWTAAARVLADPSSKGAAYIDLRLPERPAAGGLGAEQPIAPAGADPAPAGPIQAAPSPTPAPAPQAAATPDPAAPTTPPATQPAPPAAGAPLAPTNPQP